MFQGQKPEDKLKGNIKLLCDAMLKTYYLVQVKSNLTSGTIVRGRANEKSNPDSAPYLCFDIYNRLFHSY